MAESLRDAGRSALEQAAQFENQVGQLSAQTEQADAIVREASQRLLANLSQIEAAGSGATASVSQAGEATRATVDELLSRSAEALAEIRTGVDAQAAAVSALVAQSQAGIGRAGIDAAELLGERLAGAGSALDGLSARIAEQERASQRLVADLDLGLAALFTGRMRRFLARHKAQERLARFLPGSIDRELLERGQEIPDSGVRARATVLCADIHDFTAFTAALGPAETVALDFVVRLASLGEGRVAQGQRQRVQARAEFLQPVAEGAGQFHRRELAGAELRVQLGERRVEDVVTDAGHGGSGLEDESRLGGHGQLEPLQLFGGPAELRSGLGLDLAGSLAGTGCRDLRGRGHRRAEGRGQFPACDLALHHAAIIDPGSTILAAEKFGDTPGWVQELLLTQCNAGVSPNFFAAQFFCSPRGRAH